MAAYLLLKIKHDDITDPEESPNGFMNLNTFTAGASSSEIVALSLLAASLSAIINQMINTENENLTEFTHETYHEIVNANLKMDESKRKHLTHDELDIVLNLNENYQEGCDEKTN